MIALAVVTVDVGTLRAASAVFRFVFVFVLVLVLVFFLYNAKFAELADFSLRTNPYADYAVAGIRRLCRSLRTTAGAVATLTPRMAALCNWRTSAY